MLVQGFNSHTRDALCQTRMLACEMVDCPLFNPFAEFDST